MSLVTFVDNKTDPTRTTVIRDQFSSTVRGKFNGLRNYGVRYLLENKDRLGLFFVEEYLNVLQREEEDSLFGESLWMAPFILGAVISGTRHADRSLVSKLRPMGFTLTPREVKPELFKNEVGIIAERNFTLLRGITDVMNVQIKAQLISGIHQGLNPREVARNISDRILSIGRTRAEILARTETIRAHAESTLNRFELYGLDHVAGQAEILTARDSRVCSICAGLDGQVYTIVQARGIIPLHPRCRCCWLPVVDKFSLGRLRL